MYRKQFGNSLLDFLTNEVVVDLDMFELFMEDLISSNLDGKVVLTEDGGKLWERKVKVAHEISKPLNFAYGLGKSTSVLLQMSYGK